MKTSVAYLYRSVILFVIGLVSVPVALGGDSSPAYNFLNIPSSALTYSLGGVNVSAIDDDITSVDQNPALLGPEIGKQLGINYMRYVSESNFAGIRFGMAATERSAWSASVQYFGYGKIKGATAEGILTGDISPKDVCASAMYSHDITDRWRGGINLKAVFSSYDRYSAIALATDIGVNYFDPDKDLSVSIVVANLGGQVKRFETAYDRLPVDIRLGWSQSFGTLPVRWSITAWNLTKWSLPYYENGDGTNQDAPEIKDSFGSNLFRHLIFGGEFIPSDRFRISLGYNYKTRTDMATYSRSILSGFSLGASFRATKFSFGVALAQPHKGATTLMLNFSSMLSEFL